MWWLVVTPERRERQMRLMTALSAGLPAEHRICVGAPPDGQPFIACGQIGVVHAAISRALKRRIPFWLIDNGFHRGSGGGNWETGYYEFCYRSCAPILMDNPDTHRFPAGTVLKPWRRDPDGHVVLAYPGKTFGRPFGLDMAAWAKTARHNIARYTARSIVERTKKQGLARPLEDDLRGASVLVTHSSNVAVDALIAGVPAIVAPTNPAAPVCSTDLADIDDPPMPDRFHWWASLMNQQFTQAEMRDGTAAHYMARIVQQVDG